MRQEPVSYEIPELFGEKDYIHVLFIFFCFSNMDCYTVHALKTKKIFPSD